jgi:hypothetical protein
LEPQIRIKNVMRLGKSSLVLAAGFALFACGGSGGGGDTPPPGGNPPPGGSNRAPTISGKPIEAALYGRQYAFTPAASDADGDALTFTIEGRPPWAVFNSGSGRLHGAPTQADVGTNANIVISVTDGTATASLAAFAIRVVATASGSALLLWSAPTQNSDGSPLTDLASYRVRFGTSAGDYPNSLTVNGAGVVSLVVAQLTPATWYFVVTAVNSYGAESSYSAVASKVVL